MTPERPRSVHATIVGSNFPAVPYQTPGMNVCERDELLRRVRGVARFVSKRTVYAHVGACVVPIQYIPRDVVLTNIVIVEPSKHDECPRVSIVNENHANVSVTMEMRERLSSEPIAIPCRVTDPFLSASDGS